MSNHEPGSSGRTGKQFMEIIQSPPGKWIVRSLHLRKFWTGEKWSGILYEAVSFESKEKAEGYVEDNRDLIENG